MRKKQPLHLFVVRQYIWAKDAPSAIKISRKSNIHEVWLDDEYKKKYAISKRFNWFRNP